MTVILPCGHETFVAHKIGERFVICSECQVPAVVKAIPHTVVDYLAYPTQPSLPFRR